MSGHGLTPTVSEAERRRRWRLLVGPAVDDVLSEVEDAAGESDGGDSSSDGRTAPSNRPADRAGLHGDDRRIDAALGAVYDRGEPGSR